jgi:DNA-binding response OmpR family regulator
MEVMGGKPLVLVVDDEPGILRLVDLILTNGGFRVLKAENGLEALRLAEERRPDLVMLDIRMPEMDGMEVMRRLRQRTNTPIILLTGQGEDEKRILGLESGADDYIVKPFNPAESCARVRAVLRRAHQFPGDGDKLRTDGIEIDLESRLVRKDGQIVTLTRTEWRLLQELAAHAGRVMLNEEILSRVWGADHRGDRQYLRVWISRLRSKLERLPNEPKIIATFPGIGYMLTAGEVMAAGSSASNA